MTNCTLIFLISLVSFACALPRYTARPLVRGGALRGVQSLAAAADGRIYAASPFSANIAVIDPASLQWQFVSVENPVGMPWELTSAAPGQLYFYDSVRRSLETITMNGGTISPQIIQQKIPAPMKLAASPEGRLFAAAAGEKPEIIEIDPRTGARLFLLSAKAGRVTALVPAHDGGLWAALAVSRSIAHVNTLTGEITARRGLYDGVTAMAADGQDRLWAAGEIKSQPRLWRMSAGDPAGEASEINLTEPIASMAAAGGTLILSSRAGDALWAMSSNVEAPAEFFRVPLVTPGGLCLVESAAPGGSSRLFAADQYSVKEFDPQTGALRRAIIIPDYKGRAVYPTNVVASPDFLIVTSWISGTVHLLDVESGRVAWEAGGLLAPQSAVVLPGGDVLVAELASSQIVRLGRAGGRGNVIVTTEQEGPRGPCGLALAPKGGVYVTEFFRGAVAYVDPYSFFYKVIAEGLHAPEGIAVAPDGALLVAETGRRRLLRIDSESGRASELIGDLDLGLEPLTGLPPVWLYSGVAAARDGRIFLSCDRANNITVLDPR